MPNPLNLPLTGNARYMGYGSPEFYTNLAKFIASNPYGAKIKSLDRDLAQQQRLYDEAMAKYGSNKVPGHQVAYPGSSMHNKGSAADLEYSSPQARQWAHDNAAAAGFHFPVPGEAWHIEPIGSRKGLPAAAAAAGQPAPGTVGPTTFSNTSMTMPVASGGNGMEDVPQIMPQPAGPDYLGQAAQAISGGLSGLGKAFQRNAAPQQAQQGRTGPVGGGGPQYAPLASRFQFDPTTLPKSKSLAQLLAGLAGEAQA